MSTLISCLWCEPGVPERNSPLANVPNDIFNQNPGKKPTENQMKMFLRGTPGIDLEFRHIPQ